MFKMSCVIQNVELVLVCPYSLHSIQQYILQSLSESHVLEVVVRNEVPCG